MITKQTKPYVKFKTYVPGHFNKFPVQKYPYTSTHKHPIKVINRKSSFHLVAAFILSFYRVIAKQFRGEGN